MNLTFPELPTESALLPLKESPTASPAAKKLVLSPSSAAVAARVGAGRKFHSPQARRGLEVCFSGSGFQEAALHPVSEPDSSIRMPEEGPLQSIPEEFEEETGPIVKNRLKRALIEGLDNVTSDELEQYLNTIARDFAIMKAPNVAVTDVSYIDEPFLKGFKIEFVNEFITRRMCDVKEMGSLKGHTVYMFQEQSVCRLKKHTEIPGPHVTASNLPKFFYKPHFIDYLNETAWLLQLGKDNQKVVRDVEYVDGSTMCRVEFMSADFASHFMEKGIIYDRCKLHLVQEMLAASSFATPTVKISNLPKFFHEPHFKNFMKERADLSKEIVIQIKEDNPNERTCLAQFCDSDYAMKVRKEEIIYDRQKLHMEQHQQVNTIDISILKFENLPSFFHKAHFETFLNEIGYLYNLDYFIMDINSHSAGERSCVVEFSSATTGSQFLYFKPLVYGNAILHVECTTAPRDDKDKDWQDTEAEATTDDFLDSPTKADSLKGEKETKIFLELCKEKISKRTKKIVGTTAVFEDISESLRTLHNIEVFVVQCSDRYRNLSRTYLAEKNKPSTSWVYFKDMARLRGESVRQNKSPMKMKMTPTKVISTKAKVVHSNPNRKKRDSNGNTAQKITWTDAAICHLIDQKRTLKAKFDSSSYRNAALWEKISSGIPVSYGTYTAKQCKDKMGRLTDEYKLFKELGKKTGNNTPTFDYIEEMEAFIGDCVTVEPEITFSFGCVSTVGGRQSCQLLVSDEDDMSDV
ncbi:Trihelix transcription factor GT-2 [Frankliniella fusca]|uniref:Trihelix transcription factor GT-2 n=1 Tax=Frankliniella fusca TaxID=407009 RepID=A0AAE1LFE9_9NEOP|nr:Trihelix transcription factor GT-2 [Frankliniella fusca]